MESFQQMNPFSKRESHSTRAITTYKILSILSWLLSLVVSVYYTVYPSHRLSPWSIWDINNHVRTAFTMSPVLAEIYWAVLLILQVGYVSALFSSRTETVHTASSVGSHFIFNNLLHFAFVMLFVNGHHIWAEVILVVNFFNLTFLYFRHNTYPRYIHLPVASAPLAWTFVALYWNGAIMTYHPDNVVLRIFGNVFIWSIFVYGMFFIIVYKDYTMGFCLSVLTAAIGVAQFLDKIIALQWIFAFTIMATLFVFTVVVAVPAWQGREFNWWKRTSSADAERAPLLNDN